jgi:hypothetical protein
MTDARTGRLKHAALAAALVLPVVVLGGPQISVEPRSGDVGIVFEGERDFVSYTFTVRNTGNQPLRLSEVRAGCRCTRTTFDSVIAPGKTGRIVQVVDIVGFHEGPFERGVQAISNAANAPQLPLRVVGILRSHVEIDAVRPMLPTGMELYPGMKVMHVRSKMEDLQFVNAEFSSEVDPAAPWRPTLRVPLMWRLTPAERTDEDGYRYYDLVMWYPDPAAAEMPGVVTIETNHPRETHIRMRGSLLAGHNPEPTAPRSH